MELSGVALLDHLQFLISGIDNESARALLQFLAGLPPNLWIQIRASTLLPDMITACAKHPLDLATLVYLLTQSPSTMSAIPSSCIQTCLSVLDGECSPVQNGTASCTNEGRSQSRRRRKRKLSNDCTDSSETVSVLSLPENCKLAYNRPSLLMGHSLSRATQDPSFASSLYQQQQFLYLIGKLINSDYEGALTDPYAAFRLYKCMRILENLASLENLQSCKKKDLMHCVLEWIQQVLTLDSDLWIRNESEHALLPSIFAALRALTNLTNRDVDICATFCSAQGIEAAVNIVGLCKEGVSNSSTACDLVTITTALLTNCAERISNLANCDHS